MNYFIKEKLLIKLNKVPIFLPFLVTIICIYGFIVLYSAAGGSLEPFAYKQMIIFCIFMPLSLLISLVSTDVIYKFSYSLYFCTLLLLVMASISGKTVMGATRWVDLGLFCIQPSEISKIAIVLMLSKYFHTIQNQNISSPSNLIIPVTGVLIPVTLIIKQPDLGTAIITAIVAMIIFFAAGVRILYFITVGASCVISLPVIWALLHDYQKKRILIFLNPGKDPLGAGYNIIQSKIAIGSGGFFGKGLFHGTQSHLSFLPEYQTDFIFSFLAEELGFFGGLILLLLYSIIIGSAFTIAIKSKSVFKKLMVTGIISIFSSHVFINISMVMGILPVVGVPLPFISYGGTMMVSMLISFGLIMNASVHRYNNI